MVEKKFDVLSLARFTRTVVVQGPKDEGNGDDGDDDESLKCDGANCLGFQRDAPPSVFLPALPIAGGRDLAASLLPVHISPQTTLKTLGVAQKLHLCKLHSP